MVVHGDFVGLVMPFSAMAPFAVVHLSKMNSCGEYQRAVEFSAERAGLKAVMSHIQGVFSKGQSIFALMIAPLVVLAANCSERVRGYG